MEATIGVLCLFALSDLLLNWEGQALLLDDAIVISSGPSSLNVFVNMEAEFSCQTVITTGSLDVLSFAKWFLNGNYLEEVNSVTAKTSSGTVNATTQLHTVRFQVEDTNAELLNNSNITCQGFYDNEVEEHFELTSFSEPAVLLIQGILDAPEIFNAKIENGSVSLHWKQPFILTGLAINYYLFKVTVKASLGPSDVRTNNTTNQTEEEQSSFLEPYEGICNVYNICVQAVTAAGMGNSASIINFNETKKPEKVSVEEIDVKVDFMPDTYVISTYTFTQDYCFQRRAEIFELFAAFRNNRPPKLMNTIITPDSDQTISLVMKIPQSQSTEVDSVTIVSTNAAGSTKFDPISTELSMSGIHNITFLDDHSIGCSFVPGCVASGCKVVIDCAQLSAAEQEPYILNLMRKNGSLVSDSGLLPCDSIANCTAYSVSVYALYNDSHSDVPDAAHSNIPIPVCSTPTTMTEVGPGSTHLSPSSDQKVSKGMYIGIGCSVAFTLIILIASCIAAAVLIFRLKKKRQNKQVTLLHNSSSQEIEFSPEGQIKQPTLVQPLQDAAYQEKEKHVADDNIQVEDLEKDSLVTDVTEF